MSAPYDGAIHSRLSALSEIFFRLYFNDTIEPVHLSGRATSRFFQLEPAIINGEGKRMKIIRATSSPWSSTANALAEFGDAAPMIIDSEVMVRFHQTDASANDLRRQTGACQLTHFDIQNGGKGTVVDLAERMQKDFREDLKFKNALFRNTGQSSILCYVNAIGATATKANDGAFWADCSAYSSGATSCRVSIDTGSIARFKAGLLVDVVNSSGVVVADRLLVTDVRPEDPAGPTIGLAIQTGATIANCDAIADNQYIVVAASYNTGPWTVEDWMRGPTAGSLTDTFIGGVNRNAVGYRMLQPMLLRKGQSSQTVGKIHLDQLGEARANLMDDSEISVLRGHGSLIQTLRNQIEAAAFVQWPTDGAMAKRYAHMGTSGLLYQSPYLGMVKFESDMMATPNFLDCYSLGDWIECNYGKRGLDMLPGDTNGYWSRMNSTTPGGGKTLIYRMEGMQFFLDFCQNPAKQARILNLAA